MKILLAIFCLTTISVVGQNTKTKSKLYHDWHGGFVYFPLGSVSFADELISFKEGVPTAAKPVFRNPSDILGEPNYNMETLVNAVTLGCRGSIVFRFTDNALVDRPGPDLYVFEIGSGIEPTLLSISKDGISWIEVGEISGGRADVDIAAHVNPNDVFFYVKLTDLGTSCDLEFPGSDIDAVGAIGSAYQYTLSNSTLFDFGKSELKPSAITEIRATIESLKGIDSYKIEIEGHTDSIGSEEANQKLSLARANAVRNFLIVSEKLSGEKIEVKGYGEKVPVASNSTENGRQQNRRVNLIVSPLSIERKLSDVETNAIFMSFLKKEDVCKNGYPKAFNEQTFPGVWTQGIDEALTLDNVIYFFKGDECMAFNIKTNKVEGGIKKITTVFPGLWKEGIEAAINWGNGKLYFFNEKEYIRYTIVSGKSDEGYPMSMTGNWGSSWFDNGVDAAINWGNGYAYFFKGNEYVKYDISSDAPLSGYPKSNSMWESLWIDKIDGAFDYSSNEVYFFKNKKKEK